MPFSPYFSFLLHFLSRKLSVFHSSVCQQILSMSPIPHPIYLFRILGCKLHVLYFYFYELILHYSFWNFGFKIIFMKLNLFHAYPPWSEFFSSFEVDFGFDLFLFWQSCVAAFLDVVIGGRAVETPPMNSVNLLEGLSRTVVYISYSQLITLVMESFFSWHFFEILLATHWQFTEEYIL